MATREIHQADDRPAILFIRGFLENRMAVIGFIVLVLIVLAALLAPLIAPQNPYDLAHLDILDSRLPPGTMSSDGTLTYLLGTDDQGRDMLSAILYGVRISIMVGLVSTGIAFVIGASLGLLAGYLGGRIDTLIMRVADIQLAFPSILVALILLALTGRGIDKIIIALVAAQWAYYARTTRASAQVERRKEYIEAAVSLGLSPLRIMLRHLLPNCLPPLMVIAALQVAEAISLEATLSFLGLGLPVTEPSLGLLIANGFQYLMSGKYWISFFPGIALLVTVVAINLVADRLRDLFNPRMQSE
ncbi:ABC transporter permease [Herbaspirillum sp. RTI4]|uniref:ABC transporter permease n=1 Tax=Herbaspirillum sp. RTI4 TaxID=3048640 RepID=UPI002AB4F5DA|nr:ABC transporter permease [Herbaspirillum sp. RTI4]MDY7577880.1 ABC transporter permease [Herbaspirillum sp. RTI4]MEA9981674.1 ABC transporter permease [Herbaspirillum sp. RTI4]